MFLYVSLVFLIRVKLVFLGFLVVKVLLDQM